MKSQTIRYVFERETKNCVRYLPEGTDSVVGTLYVQKAVLPVDKFPTSLTVTIKAD